jgi:hypothetical protein
MMEWLVPRMVAGRPLAMTVVLPASICTEMPSWSERMSPAPLVGGVRPDAVGAAIDVAVIGKNDVIGEDAHVNSIGVQAHHRAVVSEGFEITLNFDAGKFADVLESSTECDRLPCAACHRIAGPAARVVSNCGYCG